MTRNLTSADRQRIVDNMWTTAEYLRKPPHMVHSVREAVDLRIADGLGAADYEGVHRGGSEGSIPERLVSERSDQACDDLAALDRALHQMAAADDELNRIIGAYPIYDPSTRRGQAKPGEGSCPSGRCRDHWSAGIDRLAKPPRYASLCRQCGEYRAEHGRPMPPEALRAAEDFGLKSWRVGRAIAAAN